MDESFDEKSFANRFEQKSALSEGIVNTIEAMNDLWEAVAFARTEVIPLPDNEKQIEALKKRKRLCKDPKMRDRIEIQLKQLKADKRPKEEIRRTIEPESYQNAMSAFHTLWYATKAQIGDKFWAVKPEEVDGHPGTKAAIDWLFVQAQNGADVHNQAIVLFEEYLQSLKNCGLYDFGGREVPAE